MSWDKDLQRIVEKGQEDMGKFARAMKIELFSGVIRDTRVKTGRLRGNWQLSEGSAASGEIDRASTAPAGTVPSEQASEIERGSSEDGVTYLVNNLPYAIVYEEEDAMVGRNVARLQQNVKKWADSL